MIIAGRIISAKFEIVARKEVSLKTKLYGFQRFLRLETFKGDLGMEKPAGVTILAFIAVILVFLNAIIFVFWVKPQ
jgi:hypothetical protein